MGHLELAAATFVVAPVPRVAATLLDPARWPGWWPDLELTVAEDRGPVGVRWQVAGGVTGSAELWLEPVLDGVVVHWYLRGRPRQRRVAHAEAGYRRRWLAVVLAVKDELEGGRPPGVKPVPEAAED